MKKRLLIGRIMQALMSAILWCALLCVPVVMAKYSISHPELFTWRELPIVLAVMLIYVIAIRLGSIRHMSAERIAIVSLVIANVTMITSILSFDTVPCSDYKVLYHVAQEMADGTYTVGDPMYATYMTMFNYQTGMALFESWLIRLFGDHFIAFEILNLLIINLTLALTWVLALKLTDYKSASLSLLLMSTFYPVLVTVNQLTNQHIAAPMIIGVLLCLRSRKAQWWIVGAAIAAIMNFLRPEGILLLVTALLTALLRIRGRGGDILRPVMCAVVFAIVYIGIVKAFDIATIKTGYTSNGVSSTNTPYFKFHKGLLGYDRPEVHKFDYRLDRFNEWEKAELTDAITHRQSEIAAYVSNKMIRYLGEYDWKFENTYNHDQDVCLSYPVKAFVMAGWGQYIMLVVLAIVGYRHWRRRHDIDPVQIFYLGVMYVYFFIEAFSSYRYESYPVLIIFAGVGLCQCIKRCGRKSKDSGFYVSYLNRK